MYGAMVFADDLRPGQAFALGSHFVTAEEIKAFAAAWDPLPFHVDEEAAAVSSFGGLVASGAHTVCIYQRLAATAVLHDWAVIAGRSLREVRMLAPVRPDMLLQGEMTVYSIEHRSPSRATVVMHGRLVESDSAVMTLIVEALIRRRP